MLTRDEFESVNIGDQIETDSLMYGVFPEEPTVFLCTDSTEDTRSFVLLFFNIRLGTAKCTRETRGFRWSFDLT